MEIVPKYPVCDRYIPLTSPPLSYIIPTDRPVRLYSDGIYDLFHYGHMLSLKQIKNLFENVHLIVGICNDDLTHKNKGKTVYTYEERLECLQHSPYINEIVENAPWIIDEIFIKKHNIDFVVHDELPYEMKMKKKNEENKEEYINKLENTSTESGIVYSENDVYSYVKKNKKFIPSMRTKGISTSGIITRIIKNYDDFLRRNLERGISARDLNVSKMNENIIKVKSKVKNEMDAIKEEIEIAMRFWEKMGKEFVKIFERSEDGIGNRMRKMFSRGRGINFIERFKNIAAKYQKGESESESN